MTVLGNAQDRAFTRIGEEPSGPTDNQTTQFWLILRRQRWPLILLGLIGLLAGVFHTATSPDRYYAAAVILIDERHSDPSQQLGAGFPVLRSETTVLNEMQVLRSHQLAEQVVRTLSLHENGNFTHQPNSWARSAINAGKSALTDLLLASPVPPATIDPSEDERISTVAAQLQKEIGILRVGRSFTIEVSMILHEPDLATEIANTYADAYLADQQTANRAASESGAVWVRQNIADVRERADDAARELAEFRAVYGASDPQGLRALEQRVNTLNELHATLLKRLETVAMEASYPITNGRLLSRALTPIEPALPKTWRILAAGLILGLTFGVIVATLRELRETSLRTGEDVRSVSGLPFLGYLPKFQKSRLRRLRPLVTRAQTCAENPIVTFGQGEEPSTRAPRRVPEANLPKHFDPVLFLPSVAPEHPYNDRLKGILAKLDRMSGQGGCIAAIASVNAGEGRTTLAANLAQFAALGGCRTLLIDADLQNPSLSHQLGFRNEAGLGEVLAGKVPLAECVIRLETTGLHVLPYARAASAESQTGMLRLSRHLQKVREEYDLILLDTQPLGVSADVHTLLGALTAVVLVSEWGRTPRAAYADIISGDRELMSKTAGIVLNRTVMHRLKSYGAYQETDTRGRRARLL